MKLANNVTMCCVSNRSQVFLKLYPSCFYFFFAFNTNIFTAQFFVVNSGFKKYVTFLTTAMTRSRLDFSHVSDRPVKDLMRHGRRAIYTCSRRVSWDHRQVNFIVLRGLESTTAC
jgi:hypothetical protein